MKHKILKQAYLPEMLEKSLQDKYELYEYDKLDAAQFQALAPQFKVLVTNGEAIVNRTLMESLPNLELIADFGVGYDGIDIKSAKEKNIKVTNTPGVLTDDVADLAIGLMLSLSRQIVGAQKFVEQGEWLTKGFHWTKKVTGSRLGIVGLGRIGLAIAKRASGFNMDIAYSNLSPVKDVDWQFYPSILDLAKRSDFLIIAAPGSSDNKNLVNTELLSALGADSYLINIARGSLVDEQALIHALDNNLIAGAAMDVFQHEPHVPNELFNRDNVIVTPHMASATFATRQEMSDLVFNNINAYFDGKALITPVY